ncbi:hypothetical protein [Paludisphaera rhizosphaerae]|uniref:hypothetical protein n=1 Tax=Paludisphaera rhizosphaerae TaxID=2711216 RepID=UPI0013EC39F4|nr:hypothetical protein [Paludisphaera rhizosphaerae]
MDPIRLFKRFRRRLVGGEVTFIRLMCNSLLIYVDCEPGDGQGLTLWLEPAWHVTTPQGVVAGSCQAQGEAEVGRPTREELDRVWDLLAPALLNRPIESIRINVRSQDLIVTVEGGNRVRTFVSNPEDDHTWHIRDNSTGLMVYGSPAGLEVHRGKP